MIHHLSDLYINPAITYLVIALVGVILSVINRRTK